MVEAVEGGEALGETLDFDWAQVIDKVAYSLEQKIAKVFGETQKAEFPPIRIDDTSFYGEIHKAVSDPKLAELILNALQEKGLDNYEKYLGRGAFGKVFQLEGNGELEGKKLVLKLLPYHSADNYHSYWGNSNMITEKGAQGDAIALGLPESCHLSRAYAVLTFDGTKVHYLESIDPELHKGHVVVGILTRAIQGGTLGERMHQIPLTSEAVRGYGKQLAEALHGLHNAGYVHGDLHAGNILVKTEKVGKSPYRIKLTDFGLSCKSSDTQWEWKHFGIILGEMALKTKLEYDANLNDLLLNPNKGLLVSSNCYSEEAILHHPFFV